MSEDSLGHVWWIGESYRFYVLSQQDYRRSSVGRQRKIRQLSWNIFNSSILYTAIGKTEACNSENTQRAKTMKSNRIAPTRGTTPPSGMGQPCKLAAFRPLPLARPPPAHHNATLTKQFQQQSISVPLQRLDEWVLIFFGNNGLVICNTIVSNNAFHPLHLVFKPSYFSRHLQVLHSLPQQLYRIYSLRFTR